MPVLTETRTWRKSRASSKPYRLTDEQAAYMKVALRVVHLRLHKWIHVAKVLGYTPKYLRTVNARQGRVRGDMPLRIATALRVPVQELIEGACPMCGASRASILSRSPTLRGE